MTEYFGIYNTTISRWVMDGNTIIHYPMKEIAEAHLRMLGGEHHFTVKSFGKSEQPYKKNK